MSGWGWRFALGASLLMAAGLLLRLWGIEHGLPYVYNLDEGAHFVPKAIAFFSGDYNPHYFINPPALSYLLHLVYKVYFGGRAGAQHAYAVNQTEVFVVARATSAVLGAAAVGLTVALAARLYDRRVGLLAGALMAVAFLPVYYGHLALNDGPALTPLLVSLYGSAGILTRDRRRDWAYAGVGLGLAVATKYTAGIALLPLLLAAFFRLTMPERRVRTLGLLIAAGAAAAVAFVLVNPYSLLEPKEFLLDVIKQQSAAGELGKLGQTETDGLRYYLWTLTWGLGWAPAFLALAGAALAVKDDFRKGLFLAAYPLLFIVYMGLQDRFFGRWLMPSLPAIAVLASFAAVHLSDRLSRPARLRNSRLLPCLFAVGLLIQPLVYSIHNDRVLSRADTRNLARAWLVERVPAGSKIVLEPIVPQPYIQDPGRPNPITPSGNRWIKYPTGMSTIGNNGKKLPHGRARVVYVEDYERITRPALLRDYHAKDYCWAITGSTQYGRAYAEPQKVPRAIEYYRRLKREGRVAYRVSPYRPAASPVKFSFDWSFNYYPLAYERPGPEIIVYRLPNKCGGKQHDRLGSASSD